MQVTSEQIGAVTVARLSGDLDTGTSSTAGDALTALLDDCLLYTSDAADD